MTKKLVESNPEPEQQMRFIFYMPGDLISRTEWTEYNQEKIDNMTDFYEHPEQTSHVFFFDEEESLINIPVLVFLNTIFEVEFRQLEEEPEEESKSFWLWLGDKLNSD